MNYMVRMHRGTLDCRNERKDGGEGKESHFDVQSEAVLVVQNLNCRRS